MLRGKFGNNGSYGVLRNGWILSPGLNWLPTGTGPEPAPYVATYVHAWLIANGTFVPPQQPLMMFAKLPTSVTRLFTSYVICVCSSSWFGETNAPTLSNRPVYGSGIAKLLPHVA